MHNSQDGAAMNYDAAGTGPGSAPGTGYRHLLFYENETDVCLDCHDGGGSYHIWSGDVLTPNTATANRGGGDFVFLEEDNINDAHAGGDLANWVGGYAAGHSVISAMKGTPVDPVLGTSPGGSYPADEMSCTSCHDPHGTAAYRILYQTGQSIPNALFTATIVADGINLFAGGGAPETNGNHNAYKSGFSDWCGTCHADFHAAWGSEFIHPSGQLLTGDTDAKYDAYMGTTDCLANGPGIGTPCGSGDGSASYLATVPLEDPAATTDQITGTTANSRVACMTCHRAHATSAMDAGRWDFNITGLGEDGGESGSYAIPNPYDAGQRSLCNKCHTQDEFDAPHVFTP